ncbi:hypothetical protein DFH08DRAFT_823764 [Mycena albidolilacea]|uniref:Uncharacterized protein n=1 Tax=Mycena albidolilacea TaxID=1033008 RepID=A0AAD6Z629_9AGAR|nr:hypothetical protein DFH08DRAFT_823764 [Mycena albidolilacea]
MARWMRSGAQWSPWELDEPHADPSIAPPCVQIVRARVSLVPYLRDAMDVAEQHATVRDTVEGEEDDGWEDEDPVPSHPPTPISHPLTPLPLACARSPSPLSDLPPSPSWSRLPSPSSDSLPSLPPTASSPPNVPSPFDAPPATVSCRKERQATGKKVRRQRGRVAQAKAAGFGPVPKPRHSQDYRQEEAHQARCHAARDLPSSATGNWTGPRLSKKARLTRQQLRCLRALLEDDWDLVEWDGRHVFCFDYLLSFSPNYVGRDPKLILDADSRIVAVLLGRPEGDNWDDVIAEMARAMDGVRARGVKRGVFKHQERRHHRGDFFVLKGGLMKGPGQKRPGNLAVGKEYRQLLELLALNPAIRQIAGFQSSGLARYLPKLYRHYQLTMQSIFDDQPELAQLFPNSIFPTATFNLGPDVVTPEHLDMLNYAMGCVIFRWAAYGHQTVQSLLAEKGGAARKAEIDGDPGKRAEYALGLLLKADELDADCKEVFGW